MKKLINNADDFGYSRAVNYGIADSYNNGVLTSTTLMPAMPGFNHAVELAKKNPGLGIGVHLTLTCGRPLLDTHKTLCDENGNFKKLGFYNDENTTVSDEEVYVEWKAQIEKVYKAGIVPTHLDSHHHTHTFKNNPEIVKRLAKEYDLPVRNSFESPAVLRKEEIVCNDILINPWTGIEERIQNAENGSEIFADELIESLRSAAAANDVIEVMWHTAYLDYSLVSGSSFAYPRLIENDAILNKRLIKYMKENFELCTYQNIN